MGTPRDFRAAGGCNSSLQEGRDPLAGQWPKILPVGALGERVVTCVRCQSALLVTGAVVPSQQHLWVWSLLAKQGLVEQFEAV